MNRSDDDLRALFDLAQTYFDAAYAMDADRFATVFHASSSVTKIGDNGNVSVTPINTWLSTVRSLPSPEQRGAERDDEILSVHTIRDLALLIVRLRVAPRTFTDLLSCLKVDGTWKIVQKVTTAKT